MLYFHQTVFFVCLLICVYVLAHVCVFAHVYACGCLPVCV